MRTMLAVSLAAMFFLVAPLTRAEEEQPGNEQLMNSEEMVNEQVNAEEPAVNSEGGGETLTQ